MGWGVKGRGAGGLYSLVRLNSLRFRSWVTDDVV